MKNIIIKGAREHNLKDITVTLPRDRLNRDNRSLRFRQINACVSTRSMPGGRGIAATIRLGGRMQLGTRQQIIFIDPDNRPRDWKLIVQIIRE